MSDYSASDPTPPGGSQMRPDIPPPDSYFAPAPMPGSTRYDQVPPSLPPPEDKPKKGNSRWPMVVGAVVALGLIAGGVGVVINSLGDDEGGEAGSATTVATSDAPADTTTNSNTTPDDGTGDAPAATNEQDAEEAEAAGIESEAGITLSDGHASIDIHAPIQDVSYVADQIAPSVVTISADVENEFGATGSVGTGVVITEDGNILTNAHVVNGAVAVRVLLPDTTEPVPAEVLAADPQNDLALLDISGEGYRPAVFAQRDESRLGDPVVAIGFALDLDGGPTVTLGIISALNRTLQLDDETALDGLIQTDAAISSGNSGGPLVNAAGEVVGINTAVATGDMFSTAANLGFAISVDEILQVVPELRNTANGEVRQIGFLGVGLAEREDGGKGAVVQTVTPDTPAETAGLLDGDVVLEVDGAPINGSSGLIAAIRDRQPGDTVSITVLRNGETLTVEATLADRPTAVEEG